MQFRNSANFRHGVFVSFFMEITNLAQRKNWQKLRNCMLGHFHQYKVGPLGNQNIKQKFLNTYILNNRNFNIMTVSMALIDFPFNHSLCKVHSFLPQNRKNSKFSLFENFIVVYCNLFLSSYQGESATKQNQKSSQIFLEITLLE